ncbi:MAG TPA: DUF4097 family beta strand repeat-containing protein [Longimicrobiaceae bacterium]|nr:DUF4097 family beta strand repeat-containing protein [Longimicrobiaceae bacterium]
MSIQKNLVHVALALTALSGSAAAAAAQERTEDWVERCRANGWGNRGAVHCEVREVTLPARGRPLAVDAGPNGGISVAGWNRDEILVRAKLQAGAEDESAARDLASRIRIETGETVRAEGPPSRAREHWSVSYEIYVPHQSDLSLRSSNGGIQISAVRGRIELSTVNGGISLREVEGDVRGETTNGGLNVRLAGDRWHGDGLDLRTSNGGISLAVPEGYSARLVTGTVNGTMHVDFPVTVQGRVDKRIEAELGRGGAPISVITTNGGVRIRRDQ